MAALIAVAIGVPGTLRAGWRDHPPTDPALAQPIPWLDVPAPAPTHLARREPRPATRACTPADLGVHPAGRPPLAWVEQDRAGDGYERHTVLLPNRMGSRCTLRGSAELVATDAASGQRVQLTRRFDPPTVDDVHQYPATIDAGEPARIDLTVTSRCADPAATAPRYRDIALVTLGHEFPISELEISTACPVGVGPWYVLPPLLNAAWVVASIEAPAQVRRGEALEYVVSLHNASPRPFPLNPCPVYLQRLGEHAGTYQLNCAVSTIPAHTSVRFAMRLRVPDQAPVGETRLTWMAVMADGEVAIADLATGGVPITVTD